MELGDGMNFGEWEVKILEQPFNRRNYIFLYRVTSRGTEYVTHDGTIKPLAEGNMPVVEDSYFTVMDDDGLQALADALAKRGVKTRNDHKNEGLLEATRSHLEDMRTLVFTNKKGK
jgi:hypothetical protein